MPLFVFSKQESGGERYGELTVQVSPDNIKIQVAQRLLLFFVCACVSALLSVFLYLLLFLATTKMLLLFGFSCCLLSRFLLLTIFVLSIILQLQRAASHCHSLTRARCLFHSLAHEWAPAHVCVCVFEWCFCACLCVCVCLLNCFCCVV